MELNWSRWFRCESSFSLLLVPHQPGVFALAEEIAQPHDQGGRRVLAVFEINEADDVCRALNRMFTPASVWRDRLRSSSCYVRFAVMLNPDDRHMAAAALRNWLNSQFQAAAQIFEPTPEHEPSDLTVAERAVDRVMKDREKEMANLTFS